LESHGDAPWAGAPEAEGALDPDAEAPLPELAPPPGAGELWAKAGSDAAKSKVAAAVIAFLFMNPPFMIDPS
jgi:hypothetical protein